MEYKHYDEGYFAPLERRPPGWDSPAYLWKDARFIAGAVRDWTGVRALDIGSGRGSLACTLSARGARTTALEPSTAALGICRSETVPHFQRADPSFSAPAVVHGTIEEFHADEGSFDVVSFCESIEHLEEDAVWPALEKAAALIGDAGHVILANTAYPIERALYLDEHLDHCFEIDDAFIDQMGMFMSGLGCSTTYRLTQPAANRGTIDQTGGMYLVYSKGDPLGPPAPLLSALVAPEAAA